MEIKIQSFSDIITNSSSELYVIRRTYCLEFVQEILNELISIYNKVNHQNKTLYDYVNLYETNDGVTISYSEGTQVPEFIQEFIEYELDAQWKNTY